MSSNIIVLLTHFDTICCIIRQTVYFANQYPVSDNFDLLALCVVYVHECGIVTDHGWSTAGLGMTSLLS